MRRLSRSRLPLPRSSSLIDLSRLFGTFRLIGIIGLVGIIGLIGAGSCAPAPRPNPSELTPPSAEAPAGPDAPAGQPEAPGASAGLEPDANAPGPTASGSFRRAPSGHLLVPVTFDAQRYAFILDTGASVSVVTPETLSALGLSQRDGVAVSASGANGRIEGVRLVELPPLELGGAEFAGVEAAVMSLAHLDSLLGEPLTGILGQSFLTRHHLELDLGASSWRLHPKDLPAPALASAESIEFTLFEVAPLIELQVSIDGSPPIRALLDLGAGRSILNWRAAALLGLSPDSALEAADRPMMGADGVPLALVTKRFDRLQIGELHIAAPRAYIGDIGVFDTLGMAGGPAMVLGVDLLGNRRLLFDYAQGRIQVAPSAASKPPPEH